MPRFTIDLTDKTVTRLQTYVQRYNDNNGTALTTKDWLTLHLHELAIAEDLAAAAEALRVQSEQDARATLTAAVRTTRDELIAALADAAP